MRYRKLNRGMSMLLVLAFVVGIVSSGVLEKPTAAFGGRGVTYQAKPMGGGWISATEPNPAGTVGESLALEQLRVSTSGMTVEYRVHSGNVGWMSYVSNNATTGTAGRQIEAVQIRLVNAPGWNIFYRVHMKDLGWGNWVSNNSIAGTTGQNRRIEAIEIYVTNHSCTFYHGSTVYPTCLNEGFAIQYCRGPGCGATRRNSNTSILPHSYTHNVCTRLVECGKVMPTWNNAHFKYYMYRAGYHARKISAGSAAHPNNQGIDITNGSGGTIEGFPIYAQGPGTVIAYGGSANASTGYFIAIQYDNGYTARYLHVADSDRAALNSRVTAQTKIANTSHTGKDANNNPYLPHLHYDVNVVGEWDGIKLNPNNTINPEILFPPGTFN